MTRAQIRSRGKEPLQASVLQCKLGRSQAQAYMQCMTANPLLISRRLLISSMKLNIPAKTVLLLQATILVLFG